MKKTDKEILEEVKSYVKSRLVVCIRNSDEFNRMGNWVLAWGDAAVAGYVGR